MSISTRGKFKKSHYVQRSAAKKVVVIYLQPTSQQDAINCLIELAARVI